MRQLGAGRMRLLLIAVVEGQFADPMPGAQRIGNMAGTVRQQFGAQIIAQTAVDQFGNCGNFAAIEKAKVANG